MTSSRNSDKKKISKGSAKPHKAKNLSVVTVRISDLEKERIDEVMRVLNIKRYSDVMRIALQMAKPQQLSG
ncbi:MAG: hypothetical protein A2079_04715 [Geobacteraceae bacterium GWC2_48_7]|nr:MAG: hypothetical protein A2079_04715 [Geobacteraceae bacterium GWC2_48_7]